MNDSCLGVQLHWCPIRFKTSWVLQLSHRFHKTLLVKTSPPQSGLSHSTHTRKRPRTASREHQGSNGGHVFGSSQDFSFLSGRSYFISSPPPPPHWWGGGWLEVVSTVLVLSEQNNGFRVAWKFAGSRSTHALKIYSCSASLNLKMTEEF